MIGGLERRWIATAWLVTATAALFSLAACTDDPTPPSPSGPTSAGSLQPTPTASPPSTVTPPPAPNAAHTRKGAEAFVRYFWAVHNYSYASQNTSLLESISEAACIFCKSTISDLQDLREKGATVDGSDVELVVAAVPPGTVGTRILVSTIVRQSPGTETLPDGSIRKFQGVPRTPSSAALSWANHRWIMHDVAITKSELKP